MKSYFLAGLNTNPSASTEYIWINTSAAFASWNTTESNRDSIVPHALTLDRLRVFVATAPGSGNSRTFTVMKNGSATSLTCTISDANTTAQDTSNSVSFSAGDTISMRQTTSGTPAGAGRHLWSIRQDATNLFAVTGGQTATASGAGTVYFGMHSSQGGVSSTVADKYSPMPVAGAFKNLYIRLSAAPGSGKSWTCRLYKNGAATALTVTIADLATSGSDTSNSVAVNAGDTVSIECVPSGTPAGGQFRWGLSFDPDTDGDSFILYGHTSNPSTSATNYEQPMGVGIDSWGTTESSAQLMLGATTIKSLYNLLTIAPANGPGTQSYAFTVRKNAADTAATVTISEAATSGNITGLSVSIADDDKTALKSVPASTPVSTTVKSGIGLFIDPGVSASVKDIIGMGIIPFPRS